MFHPDFHVKLLRNFLCLAVLFLFAQPLAALTLSEAQKLLAGDGAAGDRLGYSVAIDGDTALIGARFSGGNFGSAYVLTRSAGVWSQQAKLLPGDGAFGDDFGRSVAVAGDTALIGAVADDDNRHG